MPVQINVCVTVAGDGTERIEHGGTIVWYGAENPKSDGPYRCLERMQASGQQRSGTHDTDEHRYGVTALRYGTGKADGLLSDEAQTQDVNHHRQHDERHSPQPIGAPIDRNFDEQRK